jgi:hypothetical protein
MGSSLADPRPRATSQRAAALSIYAAIYALADIVASLVMASVIDRAATPSDGFKGL